jgi:hypothetical protein
VNGRSFPTLTLVELGSDRDTGPLEEAAKKLIEIRDYLFYDDPESAGPYHSKEPASPENMAELRRFLERIDKKLTAVIGVPGADVEDGTSNRLGTPAATSASDRPAAGQSIREAGEAVRVTLRAARREALITEGVAGDWDRLRDDLSRPEKWDTYQVLLERQEKVEDLISALAGKLREFVRVVGEIGNGGFGQAAAGHGQRRPPRGRMMDGRPHYIPWQSPGAERAS